MTSEQKPRVWEIWNTRADDGIVSGPPTKEVDDSIIEKVVELSEVMKLIEALRDAKETLLSENRTTAASEIDEALKPWRSLIEGDR